MGRGAFYSHSRYHLSKKKNHCLLPESDTADSLIPQSTPEQTREKTPIIRRRAKLRLSMRTIHIHVAADGFTQHDHKALLRGQPLTDPSPGTIPRICSPFPALAASWCGLPGGGQVDPNRAVPCDIPDLIYTVWMSSGPVKFQTVAYRVPEIRQTSVSRISPQ